jgi:YHS domain-containing protein
MAAAALVVDGVFSAAGLVPAHRPSVASVTHHAVGWNATSVLDIVFGVVLVALFALTMLHGAKDPVCGMTVDRRGGGPTLRVGARTIHFCGEGCRNHYLTRQQGA